MFLKQIKNLAGDCKRTHRWAKVNLTGDDQNNRFDSQNLDHLRIIGIGKTKVRLMRGNGKIVEVEPILIQQVW